jgi:hypothetical protein
MTGFDDNEWTYPQTVTLWELAAKNMPVAEIARALSRTEMDVRKKAFDMGLTIKPGNSFCPHVKTSDQEKGT